MLFPSQSISPFHCSLPSSIPSLPPYPVPFPFLSPSSFFTSSCSLSHPFFLLSIFCSLTSSISSQVPIPLPFLCPSSQSLSLPFNPPFRVSCPSKPAIHLNLHPHSTRNLPSPTSPFDSTRSQSLLLFHPLAFPPPLFFHKALPLIPTYS